MAKPITNKDLSDKLDFVFSTLANVVELLTPLPVQMNLMAQASKSTFEHMQQQIDVLARRQDNRDQDIAALRMELQKAQDSSTKALRTVNQFGGNVAIYQDLYGRVKEQLEMARGQIEALTTELAGFRNGNGEVHV